MLSHCQSSRRLAEQRGRRRLRWSHGCNATLLASSCYWQGVSSTASYDVERELASYCPTCGALQRTVLLGAVGYARLQTQFYDKRKASRNLAQFTPAWRIEQENHVGRVDLVYVCGDAACDTRVTPGVTHVRNWNKPDYWVPVPKKPRAALEKERKPVKKRTKRKKKK